jgi:uncharacterized protein
MWHADPARCPAAIAIVRDPRAEEDDMHGDLVYFVINAPDSTRARTFYGGLFGWDFLPGNVEDGFQIDGVTPPGGIAGGSEPSPPRVYFQVDSLDEAIVRIRALGGEVDEPQRGGAGSFANCRDDQGSEFSIFEFAGEDLP